MKWLIVAAGVMWLSVGLANDQKRGVIWGSGGNSCGAYVLSGQRPAERARYMQWVAGYLSAVNVRTPHVYSIVPGNNLDGVAIWLDNYCKAHPVDILLNGIEHLLKDQQQKNGIEDPSGQ